MLLDLTLSSHGSLRLYSDSTLVHCVCNIHIYMYTYRRSGNFRRSTVYTIVQVSSFIRH